MTKLKQRVRSFRLGPLPTAHHRADYGAGTERCVKVATMDNYKEPLLTNQMAEEKDDLAGVRLSQVSTAAMARLTTINTCA